MDKNYLISKNTDIGKKSKIGEWVSIGIEKNNLKTKIGSGALIRSHTVIYGGNIIGDNFQTGHGVLLRENNKIGNKVSIGSHSVIEHDSIIGNNVRIHSNVFIPEYTILKDGCWVGPNTTLTNAKYPKSRNIKKNLKGPIIKKGAIIGANATILPGIVINENAIIGAGSVVTKNVAKNNVVVGNPAKVINSKKNLPYEKDSIS